MPIAEACLLKFPVPGEKKVVVSQRFPFDNMGSFLYNKDITLERWFWGDFPYQKKGTPGVGVPVRRKAAFSGEVERVSEVIEQVYGLVYPLEAVTHDFTERAALVFVTAAHRHDGSEGDAADRSADEGGQRGADRRDCVGNYFSSGFLSP